MKTTLRWTNCECSELMVLLIPGVARRTVKNMTIDM
jgi:hypothetical protein